MLGWEYHKPPVWMWKHLGGCYSPIHAESLQVMYQAVQRTRWYRHAVRETQLPAVGVSDLPRHHQPQGHIQHEIAQEDIGITQKTAWFLTMRIRETWNNGHLISLTDPLRWMKRISEGKKRTSTSTRNLRRGEVPLARLPL